MNTLLKLSTSMLFAGCCAAALAEENKQAEVKCYLELVGGGYSINYYHLPLLSKNNKIDISKIYGIQVMANGSKQKRSVYEVKECVLADKKFKSAQARTYEKQLPR